MKQAATIKNVALFDSDKKEAEEFIRGLESQTKMEWEALVYNSNKGRTNPLMNILRYIKYFIFPFKIFLNRKKYDRIVGWQAFYGLLFAFYCRLFNVKKTFKLIIKNFTYKPKNGLVGKIYFKFMKFIVYSNYIDIFICTSETFCDYCSEVFNVDRSKFVFLPFGVNDFTMNFKECNLPTNDYVLSLGRSNRDWELLINTFKNTNYQLRIICDELKVSSLPDNIKVYKSVFGAESHDFIRNCKCMVIPIMDGRIGSGETVLLTAMSFSKPIIITRPSCLADDYVINEETGLVVDKNEADLIHAVERIYEDDELCKRLSINGRLNYENRHSLYRYGINVGELFSKI